MAAGTGNLILKRGTSIPFGGEDGGQNPILLKGMPAVQINGLSKSTDGSQAAGSYAYSNYANRLWIGHDAYATGTSEDFSALGLQPYSFLPPQTDEHTRPMWMGAEIRAFTPIKANTADTYYSILKADWDRPSDYVLCTQQAIAFAPQRIWATGTPIDPVGGATPIRRYIDWATVDHGDGTNDPWRGATVHLSKKLVIPVATPSPGQTLVVAADGVQENVNGVDVITLAWAQSGGGSTLTLNGDTGTASVANATETITFAGGDGISTVVTQNSNILNTVTISQNINELTAKTPVLADAIAINDSEDTNAIKKSTFTDIRNLIRSNLNIGDLNAATVSNDDKLIIDESGTVKRTTVGDLVDFIGGDGTSSDVTVSNTGQTTIGAGKVTNAMLATANAGASNNTVALRDGTGNLVANQFTGPSTLVKGTATTTGSANKILFASSISGTDVTVAYDNAGSPLRYDAANSKLIVQNLEVLGTEQVNTKITAAVGAPYLTLNSDYSMYSGVGVGGITANGTSNSEPVENARVIVNRGPLADTELRWNETTEKWELVTTKTYTNALSSIVKSTSGGLTINYNPSGYTRRFQVGEYISISGLANNKEYNNLWKVASSTYTNITSASFTVTEKTVRHSQIVIAQDTPSGRTQFTVTHDYTYPIPTGTQNVTITGNTTSVLNNTYTGANVSSSTSTQLVFDVQTSSYSGLNNASGTNVASADTNHVTTTANGATGVTVSAPDIDCKLTGVWAYPLMYADGADVNENNTGEEQIIDKLTVRTLNMAGTWILNSSITTDLNLGSGGLILPQGTTVPSNVTDEGRIFWDTDDNLLRVGAGSNASKTFVDTDSTQTLSGKSINSIGATNTTSNTTIHSQVTTGSIALGGGVTTGTITIGNAVTTGTITIGNGANTTASKTINIGTGGGNGGATNINLGSTTTGATGTTTINSTTFSVPNPTSVGLSTAATANTNIDIGTGVTASGSTKAINIGTAGASGSGTNINLGSATTGATGTTTINSATTTTINSATFSVPNATSVGLSTAATGATTVDIGTGGTLTGLTKAINIGTAGASGSITNVILGSAVSGATGTTTINSLTTTINSTTFSASNATSVTLGNTTSATTVDIGTGGTLTGLTKAINMGTGGASGSTTSITLGSAVSGATGTTTINSATSTTINSATTTIAGATFSAANATSISLGTTTTATTVNIGTGANTSGTKAINIGTGGGANGTTTVTIGSCAASHTSNVYLGSSAGTSVVQVSNNALIFKDTGTNRITLSSASTIGAAATHTLPNITSGNVVIAASTSDFNKQNYILMGAATATSPSVFTDKDTVVVGGVRVNMQNSIATNVRYPIPFLGSNRSIDATDPAAGFTFTEGSTGYQDSYLYANMAAAGTATGAPTNYTNGLFYEVNDANASTVGTLFCDYIGATLDCGTY